MLVSSTLAPPRVTEVAAEAAELEALGCHRLWVGEGRLRRDAVTALTLAATATTRIRLASGVVPARTRNVAVTAMTWKALYDLAPDRVDLGLGAWWEPIASKCGAPVGRPLTVLREHVTVLRALFRNESVTLHGDYVDVDGIRFDDAAADAGTTYAVPIFLAAVGPRMLDLAAEIADGALLDFLVPTRYTTEAVKRVGEVREGAATAFSLPQLVACFTDSDPGVALRRASHVVVRYLAQQDHIARHSGADPELVARIRATCTWPATQAELDAAVDLVPSSLVKDICAVGTPSQVAERIAAYHEAGADEVVLSPFAEERRTTLSAIMAALRAEQLVDND